MSADNWAICPQCRDRAKVEYNARFQAAVEAYGKVTPEEYERLRDEATVPFDAGKKLEARRSVERAKKAQELLDRCTCDVARPYWHSFHREGCPLAR